MSGSPALLLELLRELRMRVCDTYPYAHLLGAELRRVKPDWWHQFRSECPELALAPLPQARDFGFLEYLEERAGAEPHLWEEMLEVMEDFFLAGEPYLLRELHNTVEWYRRATEQAT